MASLIEDNRDRSEGMKKAADEAAMASLDESQVEKKRAKNLKKKAKKAAQKAKKKKEKEATLAAEQSAQQALDNKKAEEDDEWNERYYGPQGKPQKAPPILSMMGVMPVINKATYKIRAKHTKAVPLKLADNTTTLIRIPREYTKKPQTVTQEEFAAMSPAEQDVVIGDEINLHVKNV